MKSELSTAWAPLFEGPIAEAACVSWIRGVGAEDVLRRLGGTVAPVRRTLPEVDAELMKLHHSGGAGEPIGALAAPLDGYTLLVKPNGWAATEPGDLGALSAGTEVVSIFWNVNALAEVTIARDGQIAAKLHDVIVEFVRGDDDEPRSTAKDVEGTTPQLAADLVGELARVDGFEWEPIALRWAEHYTGAALPAGTLEAAHPSVVFRKRR